MISLALRRSLANGEMKEVSVIRPASFISFATSATRRIFSIRSCSLKPRFLFRPIRTLSPSRSMVCLPSAKSLFSTSLISVDLPAPDRPVIQIVLGSCPFCCARSSLVTSILCHVRLSSRRSGCSTTPQAEVILVIRSINTKPPSSL